MNSTPKVTVGIPTRNRREYVMEAIRSVLAQTYENLEVIVSDNQSSDDTWEHLSATGDPRVKAIHQHVDIGMVGNFNAVLEAASGDFFLLLSDDDLLKPSALEKLTAPFREAGPQSASIGLSWCPCVVIDAHGGAMWETAGGPQSETSAEFISGLWLGHRGPRLASVMVRTQDARSVGGYDAERFGAVCDTANWAQVAIEYDKVFCAPNTLVMYRVHPSSGTSSAACRDWQDWGANLHAAVLERVKKRGSGPAIRSIEKSSKPLLANLTVDVLMRGMGKPGWKLQMAKEFWRSRTFMFTPYVAGRIAKDGVKLLRLK